MATLLHYFPFIDGAYDDVAGTAVLAENATGAISALTVDTLRRIYFETDTNGLNITGATDVVGDWSLVVRARLLPESAGKYPVVLALDNMDLYFGDGYLYLDYANGTGGATVNAFVGDSEVTPFSGIVGREFLVVITVSSTDGLRLYANNQQGWGVQENLSYIPTLILGTSVEKHIGPRNAAGFDGHLYLADVAFFSGVLTLAERTALYNAGVGFPLVACTIDGITSASLDTGVYGTLCPVVRLDVEVSESTIVVLAKNYTIAAVPYEYLRATDQINSFRQQAVEIAELLRSITSEQVSFVVLVTELLNAADPKQYLQSLTVEEYITTSDARQLAVARDFLDALASQLTLRSAVSMTLTELAEADTTMEYSDAVLVMEALGATTAKLLAVSLNRTDTIRVAERLLTAVPVEVTELLESNDEVSYEEALRIMEYLGTSTAHALALSLNHADAIRIAEDLRSAIPLEIAELLSSADSVSYEDAVQILDALSVGFSRELALSLNRTDTVRAVEQLLTAIPVEIIELLNSADALSYEDAIEILEFLNVTVSRELAMSIRWADTLRIAEQLRSAIPIELLELVESEGTLDYKAAVRVLESVAGSTPYLLRFAFDRADTIRVAAKLLSAIPVELLDLVESGDALSLRDILLTIERIRTSDAMQSAVTASLVLGLLARTLGKEAFVSQVEEGLLADTELGFHITYLAQILEALVADTQTSQTLVLSIDEMLEVTAEDELQGLRHYLENIHDYTNGWVGFRLGDEDFTGWVMNTEGEMPLSEYTNYQFNSFCRVGDVYLGAADEGLYLLDGESDEGDPIESAVRTMMLDFGSPVMKRVRRAYLGYTSNGKLMLKVGVVANGELKEQWYEAKELPAQAPREQMVQLGRGLRSRYWQFELTNVDGADFELDMLELHPVYLNRRK
jgi:hypothetical protein